MRQRSQGRRRSVGQEYVQAGLWSREITESEVPTPSKRLEGNIEGGATRKPSADPARSENLGMHGISMRENREIPPLPAPDDRRTGRSGKAKAASLR